MATDLVNIEPLRSWVVKSNSGSSVTLERAGGDGRPAHRLAVTCVGSQPLAQMMVNELGIEFVQDCDPTKLTEQTIANPKETPEKAKRAKPKVTK